MDQEMGGFEMNTEDLVKNACRITEKAIRDWFERTKGVDWTEEFEARVRECNDLRAKVAALTADRDSWMKQAEDRLDIMSELTAQLAEIRGALQFYADESSYRGSRVTLVVDSCSSRYEGIPVADDSGARARAALVAFDECGKAGE
jgi:phosphoserine phosphatase